MTTALDARTQQDRMDRFYRLVRAIGRFWLWFFFKSVDRRHPERVPEPGAARIALAYEAEHPGELRLVPVGLTFEARKSFRGRVLVSFGPPVPVTPYLDAYRRDPVKAVEALTTAIQWAMEAEVVHVERIDATQLVRAVEELYRGELARELQEERGLPPRQIAPLPS